MADETLTLPSDVGYGTGVIDSTGLVKIAGDFEIKPGRLSLKLPAFTGYIFDVDELKSYKINFSGLGDYSPAFLTTQNNTYLLINKDGTLIPRFVEPTEEERRTNIYLCAINHPAGYINNVTAKYDYIVYENNVLGDALRFLDPVIRGCKVTPGIGMSININSGSILLRNTDDAAKTDVIDIEASANVTFIYTDVNSNYSTSVNVINPDSYDNGGVIMSIPAGKFTVQRIGILRDKRLVVQYGDILHSSMSSALEYITDADLNYELESGIANGATLAYLAVQQGISDLSVRSSAQIHKTNNFGESLEPPGLVSSSGALLAANNLSDLTNVAAAKSALGAGVANGLATLDANGKLTTSELPFTKQYYGFSGQLKVHNTQSTNVVKSIYDVATSVNATNVRVQFHVIIADRNLLYAIVNDTTSIVLASGMMSTSGFQSITLAKPTANAVISIKLNKNIVGGTDPLVSGLIVSYE